MIIDHRSITFFVEGNQVPATRFRILQYVPHLRHEGHEVRICSSSPTKYLWYPKWINQAPFLKPFIAAPLLAWIVIIRIRQILQYAWRSDVIVIQRDLLHHDPLGILERLIVFLAPPSCRIVFDIDDALFSSPSGRRKPAQERKYKALVPNYDLVISGNTFLDRFFLQFGPSRIIPTVIDTDRFTPAIRSGNHPVTIGWTGVSSNLRYLQPLVPVLRELQNDGEVRILIITNSDPSHMCELAGLSIEWIPWSEEKEVDQLREIDIGIMPLDDSEWTRGKCGFKLLQYMSVGIPAVASAVGVNAEIINHEQSGFLASTEEDWRTYLTMLCNDPDLRITLGHRARQRVCEGYSVNAWRETFARCVTGSPSSS